MVNAYRDDLEAAQQRADGLERELAELRTRSQALEQRLAEVPVQTRVLEAALDHERRERERLEGAVDDERRVRAQLETERAQRDAQALVVRAPQLRPAVSRRSPAWSIAASVSALTIFCAVLPGMLASVSFVIGLVMLFGYAQHENKTKSRTKES